MAPRSSSWCPFHNITSVSLVLPGPVSWGCTGTFAATEVSSVRTWPPGGPVGSKGQEGLVMTNQGNAAACPKNTVTTMLFFLSLLQFVTLAHCSTSSSFQPQFPYPPHSLRPWMWHQIEPATSAGKVRMISPMRLFVSTRFAMAEQMPWHCILTAEIVFFAKS